MSIPPRPGVGSALLACALTLLAVRAARRVTAA